MKLEFNRSPYFDDYSSDNNHARVLFKDGAPLQVRELNNMQGIMQNQIRSFGDHVFMNGSRVSNGRAKAIDYDYILLNALSAWDGTSVDLSVFEEGSILKGRTTQLLAYVIKTSSVDGLTVYLSYSGTAIDGETRTFIQGETIDVLDADNNVIYTVQVACPSCAGGVIDSSLPAAIGKGTVFVVEEGIFYYNGMFINTAKQSLIISPFVRIGAIATPSSFQVGFNIIESIVTSETDESLFDNSLGYPNKRSPGADRHKIEFTLVKREDGIVADIGFIMLASYVSGIQIMAKADSEYSVIMDTIAKRTYEESGNYTVRPQEVRFIQHKAEFSGDPDGFSVDGAESNYVAVVSPNVSYVKGYRQENKIDYYVIAPKARETKVLPQYINQFEELSYILLKPMGGTSAYACSPVANSKIYDGSSIALYDGLVNDAGGGSYLPTGSQIGSIKVFDASLESGIVGSGDAVYRYYLYDPVFVDGKSFADVKCAFHPTNKFIAAPVFEDGVVKIQNKGRTELIWKLKKSNIKSLRDSQNSDNGSITLTRRAKLSGTIDSQGNIYFAPDTGEAFVALGANSICILTTEGVPNTINLDDHTVDQTPSGIRISLGQINSGKELILITNLILTKSKERTKRVLINTDTVTSVATANTITLSKADVKKIRKITAYPKLSLANVQSHVAIDVELFEFHNGQTDVSYSNGWIKMIGGNAYPTPVFQHETEYNLLVEYDYYEHSGVKGALTVDSYTGPIQSGDLTYSSIPAYISTSGLTYPLAFCMDFRPLVVDGVTADPILPAFGEMALFDMEYYLPRVDLLQVSKTGSITTKLGIASDTPIPPQADNDNMALFELWLSAYTYKLTDIKFKRIDNKRYTMKDIGKLASRLKKVEYYTVLNLLEKSASELGIKDGSGYDRFKNGFIVDNFKNFQAADTNSTEFRSAIDKNRSEMRPTFGLRNRKLVFDAARSSRYQITGGLITLPYVSVIADDQPFATKNISINPFFMFTKKGSVALSPNVDTWVSTTRLPEQVITQDFGTAAFAGMTNRMNSEWGAWSDLNSTTLMNASPTNPLTGKVYSGSSAAEKTAWDSANTATELANAAAKAATSVTVAPKTNETNGSPVASSRTDTYDLGSRLTDVSLAAFMRQVDIAFSCANMAPGTRVYVFFDEKAVSDHARPINGTFGDPLVTDSLGNLVGVLRVPGDTFRVGDKKFKLTGDVNNLDDIDTIITYAETSFYSGGVDQTTQALTLNTISPTFNYNAQRDATKTVRVIPNDWAGTTTTNTVSDVIASDNAAAINNVAAATARLNAAIAARAAAVEAATPKGDPVAQSFALTNSAFITKLDVFLAARDMAGDVVWVEIRTMDNGYPTTVALARKEYSPEYLVISDDSLTPHEVVFDSPVYIEGGKEYCFVVGGSSPNTRIWVARVGNKLIDNPAQIVETQPSLGSSFRSQSGSTWTAEQFEDIKYNLYTAQFIETSMNLAFTVPHETEALESDSLEFESSSTMVRVHMKDHAAMAGDTFSLTVVGNPADVMGIPVGQINGSHVVIYSDATGFTFAAATAATSGGRYDGDVTINTNVSYNVVNTSCSNAMYGCTESWTMEGVASNPHLSGSLVEDYLKFGEVSVELCTDIHLSQAYKLVTPANSSKMDVNVSPDTVIRAKLSTTDKAISPVINPQTLSTTFVSNRVGSSTVSMNQEPNSAAQYVDETDPIAGVEQFKYISRKVILNKPAEDLYIMVDAYKDDLADFNIYYRSVALNDSASLETLPWIDIPFTKTSNPTGDKMEYEIQLSDVFSSTWAAHGDISSFQIKIVGKTINSSNPPLFANLRIIAAT